MQHKFKLTIIGGLLFSYLFYQQNLGINAIIFSIVLLVLMIIKYPKFTKNKYSIICAIGSIFSAFFIYWNNSTISIIAYFISILGMMAFKDEGNFTIINYTFTYFINLIASPIIIFNNYVKSLTNNEKSETENEATYYDKTKKLSGFVAVFVIIVVFFFIYRSANPLFYQYTKNINLLNIDFGFIFFSIFGCLLLFVLMYNTSIKFLYNIESKQNSSINLQNFLGASLEKYRLQTIFFLFVVLNIMLFFINSLDVNYLYLAHALPKGINNSKFVHNGVGTLIFSIILGASIICYLFKGELNFIKENKTIKILVFAWIAQNIFMVISTMIRNNIYVFNFGLTGKRIGVYYYLFFTIIGLLFTAYKIHKQKTLYFLYATNTWIWYVLLVFSCAINWENVIFNNNMQRFESKKILDLEYTTRFAETNLPELISLFNVGKNDSIENINPTMLACVPKNYSVPTINNKPNSYVEYMKYLVETDLLSFLYKYDDLKWQSKNKNDNDIYKKIIAFNNIHKFDSLSINYCSEGETPIRAVSCLSNLKVLEITSENVDWQNLSLLKNVEKIKWNGTDINSLKYFKLLPKLKVLELINISKSSKGFFKNILPNVTVIGAATTATASATVETKSGDVK